MSRQPKACDLAELVGGAWEMVKLAIPGFPKRVRHCVASGGETFKHRKLEGPGGLAECPILAGQGEETDRDDD